MNRLVSFAFAALGLVGVAEVARADAGHSLSLSSAVSLGVLQTVRHLATVHSADVNEPSSGGKTPLHFAGEHGRLEIARYLASRGARADLWDDNNHSPLHLAAAEGRPDLIRFFVHGLGLHPDRNRDGRGDTPLHSAARRGQTESVRALLDLGAAATIIAAGANRTALDFAVNEGHSETARLLIMRGAQFAGGCPEGRVPDPNGESAKCVCAPGSADHDDDPDAGECLVGAHVSGPLPHGSIFAAAERGMLEIVAHMATVHSYDIDEKDDAGWTPLHWAAFGGHLTIVRFLVDEGATVNAESVNGDAPLDVAAGRGHSEVVRFLADNGGVPDIVVRLIPGINGTLSAARADGSEVRDGESVPRGTTVVFTASPDGGYYVAGWTGCARTNSNTGGDDDGRAKECAVAAGADLNAAALFSDRNECVAETDLCAANSECRNTEGDYDCDCDDGFHGDGKDKCFADALPSAEMIVPAGELFRAVPAAGCRVVEWTGEACKNAGGVPGAADESRECMPEGTGMVTVGVVFDCP